MRPGVGTDCPLPPVPHDRDAAECGRPVGTFAQSASSSNATAILASGAGGDAHKLRSAVKKKAKLEVHDVSTVGAGALSDGVVHHFSFLKL